MEPESRSSGLTEVVVTAVNHGDGSTTCGYTPTDIGTYVIKVKCDGRDVIGTPVVIATRRPANVNNSWAEGPGLSVGMVHENNFFTVYARDDSGNPVWHEDDCLVPNFPD